MASITYSGILAKDWISQIKQGINCYQASSEMLNNVGVQTAGRGQEILIVNKGGNGRAGKGNGNFDQGIYTINSPLQDGKPIMVGADYREGSPNVDGMTDHFIVISSLTENLEKGVVASTHYNFFDLGTKYLEKGVSSTNLLFIRNNQLAGSYLGVTNYVVVTVRRNK